MAAVAIRGTTYPVVLPKLRDPRLHLAATITSLQVLGQVAFHFRLSIAQILISLGTAAALEVAITLGKQRVIMWPASALLTANGVAFVLRVPGTRHGDWWSLRGWWIYVAVAGGSLLSKHVIAWKGEHFFNPSNIGLVVCFLALGRARVEPLDFWWGPMSWWMALALAIIVTGGFAILRRLKLLRVALSFWAGFAVSVAILALRGHAMVARWHLGPITGFSFWWVLVTSPEVLVFLFFMITDPKTAPTGLRERVIYGAALGVLAGALIAPTSTEFASKVALLSALAVVCATKPLLRLASPRRLPVVVVPAVALAAGVLVFGNGPSQSFAARPLPPGKLPPISILPSPGVQTQLDRHTAELIAHDLLAQVGAAGRDVLQIHLVQGSDQGPPNAVAVLAGRTFRLAPRGAQWVVQGRPALASAPLRTTRLPGLHLADVASQLGVDFRQGSFHYGSYGDVKAMMGGGVCFLDYNGDGWVDLFVVNSYASGDTAQWEAHGGLPASALYRNDHGRFVDVSAQTHANLAVQGDGCAAADLNGDGHTDLVVTSGSGVTVLWNTGHGSFEQQQLAGAGWYTGVAVADVNGDGRPDVFAAGYADPSEPVPGSFAGFPTNLTGVRDLLFLNSGGRRFHEAGIAAGLEASAFRHGLGAEFVDVNRDGRPDLYVANDEDPNQLYVNVPWPGGAAADPEGLGFRFEDRAVAQGVADPNAGMGIATRLSGAGTLGIFVSNSRNQESAAYEQGPDGFRNARPLFGPALGTGFAGWGASWVDLANSGNRDLVLAAGAIPVTSLARDAEQLRVLGPAASGYADVQGALPGKLLLNGRGVAAADVGNDGRMVVAVNTIGGKLVLLRQTGAIGNWLDVAVSPAAPGTTVTATLADGSTEARTIAAGSSYLSSEDPRVHFGLGRAARVRRLVVRAPSGAATVLTDVAGNRLLDVHLPKGATRTAAATPRPACVAPRESYARLWNGVAQRVLLTGQAPAPVQARDLYLQSLATARAFHAESTLRGRDVAISFANERLLVWLASFDSNLAASFRLLETQLRGLCLDPTSRAARTGERIASTLIAQSRHDGSNELLHYADPSFTPKNQPGGVPHDATFWQPLAGQVFVGAQWGRVRRFAASRPADPGAPPLGDPSGKAYAAAALGALRATAPAHVPVAVDASPVAWNARLAGVASRGLAWDVHLELTLNGALNDAAVAVYAAKRRYDAPRPIELVRYLALSGTLPLVDGLTRKSGGTIEVQRAGRWVRGDTWTPAAPTPASPGWPSEDAAFAYAADTVLSKLTGRSFAADAVAAARSGVAAGVELALDVAPGRTLGIAAGRAALTR